MDPSIVRARILQEHARLRTRLDALEHAVDAMAADRSQQHAIREAARELLSQLIAHTEAEDAILAPALREIDAWGPVRAGMLLEHHESQRAQLMRLVELYGGCSCEHERLAALTLEWIYEVRADMTHEESSSLSAALLKDDPIAVGMECS